MPVGVVLSRAGDCPFVEFNDAAAHNLGYTRAEFARLTIGDLEVSATEGKAARAASGWLPETFETRMRAKDGAIRNQLVSTHPVEIGGELVTCGIWQDITERKRVEEVLRQQLSIIETITSTAADGVFMTDEERRVTFLNPAAERMFGFTFDEFRGKNLHGTIHHSWPDGTPYPASECPLNALYTGGKTTGDHRDVYFRKDGTPVYVSVSNAPLIRQGQLIAAVVIIRDVTEGERTERELAEANERLEAALAAAELGVWSYNFETGAVHWDDRMKSMLGLPPLERLTMAESFEFVHPDDRERVGTALGLHSNSANDAGWECRVVPRGGKIRWHQSRGRFIRDAAGKLVSARGVTRDITDQKLAQETRERLAAIVESSEDAIASCTLDGILTSHNRGAEALYGYTAAEMTGCSVGSMHPPERRGEMAAILSRIAQGESISRHETERITKDGRRIVVSMTLSPMRDDAGLVTGVSIVTRDMTREKLLEEKLRQAEKMEAIGRLAGGIAHDFNNLLTIINGYAGMALVDATDNLLREQLLSVHAAGERAIALTGQLLAFSRKQMLQLRIVNINSVVEAMYPLLRRVIREDIQCVMDLDTAVPRVQVDPHQIERVLLNLVVNAGDALACGGHIRMETKDLLLDDEYCRLHPEAVHGRCAMLAVTDNGAGMEPGVQVRIFEPFFTTKPMGKGTGLGLSMVYGIVKQSGGHITCDSEPGKGTTFRVYLPAVYAEATHGYPAEEDDRAPDRGTETILLVEDDAELRAYTARVLRGLGYSVHEAADGEKAIRLGESDRAAIDLLVTDMVMPGVGGREVAAALNPLRTLFISGYTEDATMGSGEGSAFLAKPFSPHQLGRKVREVLVQQQGIEK